jgi:hypothetical protein
LVCFYRQLDEEGRVRKTQACRCHAPSGTNPLRFQNATGTLFVYTSYPERLSLLLQRIPDGVGVGSEIERKPGLLVEWKTVSNHSIQSKVDHRAASPGKPGSGLSQDQQLIFGEHAGNESTIEIKDDPGMSGCFSQPGDVPAGERISFWMQVSVMTGENGLGKPEADDPPAPVFQD